jgi:hypothetical protein
MLLSLIICFASSKLKSSEPPLDDVGGLVITLKPFAMNILQFDLFT